MRKTTESFKDVICGDNRKFYIKIRAGDIESTDSIRSLTYNAQCTTGEYVTVGGAFSAYVNLELWNPGFELENAEFELLLGLEVDGEPEWCSLGFFTGELPKTSLDGLITLTAYDRMQSKLSGAYFSNLTYPADATLVLEEISQMTGVEIDISNLTSGVMINQRKVVSESTVDESGEAVETITYTNPFDGYTYTEALGYIAMLFCKFAVVDSSGKVKFNWYQTADRQITADEFYTDFEKAELAFSVKTVVCNTGDEELTAGQGERNVSLENPIMTQERLDYIYEQLKSLQFIPTHFSFYGDIRFEPGDMPTVKTLDGNIYNVPIMSISQSFDGGLQTNVQSYGGINSKASVKGIVQNSLERQYTELLIVKNLLGNKANFDYVYSLEGEFEKLKSKSLTVEEANIRYANIDFSNINMAAVEKLFAKSGIIKDLVVDDQHITGELVGVTIKGDLIEGNTVVAEKLVIKGEDGLYYKLNTDGITTEAEQTEYNSLNGQIICARSITASKIDVEDLVAFGATIGGFHISDDSIYSGAKESVHNTTNGLYMDKNGQIALGDSNQFIKYYKDEKGEFHLKVALESLEIGVTNVEEAIQDAAGKALLSSVDEYYQSDSPTELIGGEWSQMKLDWEQGKYVWRRTKNTYGDGHLEYTNEACITGNTGESGKDSILLYIESSNGTVFKNNSVSTNLTVVLYYGNKRITDAETMKTEFGDSAYLQWKWKMPEDDDYIDVALDDYRIKGDGFLFTISPDDVTMRATFVCNLIV